MAQYCVDTLVRSWLVDDPAGTYKSSRITFIVEYDGLDFSSADFNDPLDALIQEHGESIQGKYIPGGITDQIVVISPEIFGITEC